MTVGRSLKVSLVGDGAVGKTCLWNVYTKNFFPPESILSVLDECSVPEDLHGVTYKMTIWDTAGQEEYDRLRLLTYPNTNVFVICYAVNSRSSFANVTSKWVPEIKKHYPNTPMVLVGTKVDTNKTETKKNLVSSLEGKDKCKEIGATNFVECSALEKFNVRVVFQEALKSALGLSSQRHCTIL